jgi:hypothetical protein
VARVRADEVLWAEYVPFGVMRAEVIRWEVWAGTDSAIQ